MYSIHTTSDAAPLRTSPRQRVSNGADCLHSIVEWAVDQNSDDMPGKPSCNDASPKDRPTAKIEYVCVLPKSSLHVPCFLDTAGQVPLSVGPVLASAFYASSLSGGEVQIEGASDLPCVVSLRWLCMIADPEIGCLWRLFARTTGTEEWRAAKHDYFYDNIGVTLLAADGVTNRLSLPDLEIDLEHPEDGILLQPSAFNLVKVFILKGDGLFNRRNAAVEQLT